MRCPQMENSPVTRGWTAAHRGPMPSLAAAPLDLRDLIDDNDGVLLLRTTLKHMSRDAIRWRISSGRWQQPCHRVLVTQAGPLTDTQKQRVAAFWGGPGAALSGLTAARLGGLTGFDRDTGIVHLLRPGGRKTPCDKPPFDIVVRYSRRLGPRAVSPNLTPCRTRIARSLVDAAEWMPTDRGAQALLAAGVQQGLTRVTDLRLEVDLGGARRRRELMWATLRDIEGGSQALSELDFLRLVVRGFGLPEPDRQAARRDGDGKRRYLDVVWEWARVAVEIDGAGHLDMLQYWDDMDRDNQLKLRGYTVLRFPAVAVRQCPEKVARQIRAALEAASGTARLGRRRAVQQEVG